jgi:ABC-type glycerol-3-phosphate transport system substrate-binding protein
MRRTWAVAAVVLLAGGLAGCGGGGDDDNSGSSGTSGVSYCDAAKDVKDQLNTIDVQSLNDDALDTAVSNLDALIASAPADVKGNLEDMKNALEEFRQILDDAGISLDDLQSGSAPSDVDPAKLAQLQQDLSEWTSKHDIQADQQAIAQSLQDECGIKIDETGSGS